MPLLFFLDRDKERSEVPFFDKNSSDICIVLRNDNRNSLELNLLMPFRCCWPPCLSIAPTCLGKGGKERNGVP